METEGQNLKMMIRNRMRVSACTVSFSVPGANLKRNISVTNGEASLKRHAQCVISDVFSLFITLRVPIRH